MKTILKTLIILVLIIGVQSCSKSNSAPASTTTTPTPTFTAAVDGANFTPTSINGAYGNGNNYYITAIYSSGSITQEIILYLNYDANGSYTLGLPYTGNYGLYNVGPNLASLVTYTSAAYSPIPTGTLIITSSANNVVSGTFGFTGGNTNATPNTHTINGSFSNIQL